MLTDDEYLTNFTEIKELFDRIDLDKNSNLRQKILHVSYKTDKPELDFECTTEVTVNISNRNYYSIELNDLDENEYHTSFDSRYLNFNFDETRNCLTIKGNAHYKNFTKYKVSIFI